MKKTLLLAVSVCLTFALLAPAIAEAQEDEEPEARYVVVTSFKVPYYDRDKVVPFVVDRVLPGTQLNPKVVTARLLFHNWGSDAADMAIVAEYENIEDIHAECGAPCEEYYEANPSPEEGEAGYEEFREQQKAFDKYYARHSDEIYFTPMEEAVVEGAFQGTVGYEEEEEEM